MDWSDTPEQAQFRAEVQKFIREQLPQHYLVWRDPANEAEDLAAGWQADRKSADPRVREAAEALSTALAKRGWIAPRWPKAYGGAGLSPTEQYIFDYEMAAAGAPPVGGMGVWLLGPTLILHGNEEQKATHLPRILSGEVAWAQGYSEPGSGSDLASLITSATRDGDEFVVNGQKIWTSGAQYADWLFALVRTDPDAAKHRGISFIVADIHTPGITIRPLGDMSWNEPFNEVFFEEVRLPATNVIGDEQRGWYVAMSLLDFERSSIRPGVGYRRTLLGLVEHLHSAAGKAYARADLEPTRQELADRYIEVTVLLNFGFHIVDMQERGERINYEPSMNKLFASETHQRLARSAMKAFGLYGMLWQDEAPLHAYFVRDYISAVPHTIFSGTSEIQRNIIAERGLGLPRG